VIEIMCFVIERLCFVIERLNFEIGRLYLVFRGTHLIDEEEEGNERLGHFRPQQVREERRGRQREGEPHLGVEVQGFMTQSRVLTNSRPFLPQ